EQTSLPPYRAPGTNDAGERTICSQVASASRTVFAASVSVPFTVAVTGRRGKAPRTFPTGGTRGQEADRKLWSVPRIHRLIASDAQPEKSADDTLCPTPGTVISWPCGKAETTATAFAVGVRRSNPPLRASTGTFGSGPGPSGVFPVGVGHCSQK